MGMISFLSAKICSRMYCLVISKTYKICSQIGLKELSVFPKRVFQPA